MVPTNPDQNEGHLCISVDIKSSRKFPQRFLCWFLSPNLIYTVASAYLCVPLRVDGVAGHPGALLLPMVGQRGEDAVLPWLDRQLKVGVRIEEHSFL